jgi:glycosidase
LTNPGVPFVYYGEEIGMRGAKPDPRIRTPMQWDASEAAGFTSGSPWEELSSGHESHNVALESGDPGSLLSHYRTLIRLRQDHPALRVGDMVLVESDRRDVYSFLRFTPDGAVLVVANLSDERVDDYTLGLESGPLSSIGSATLQLGEGEVGAPVVNATGGIEAYTPLDTLAPRASAIILLEP